MEWDEEEEEEWSIGGIGGVVRERRDDENVRGWRKV